MRSSYLLLFILFFLLSACSSGETQFEQVPAAQVDRVEVGQAQMYGDLLLRNCVNQTYDLMEEEQVTEIFYRELTQKNQLKNCEYLRSKFGTFADLIFVECLKPIDERPFRVYRFKTKFTEHALSAETRIVLDEQSRLAGMWTGPWRESTNL